MWSGKSGNVPKADASIVTFPLTSILCPFTSITSLLVSMEARLFLRISPSPVCTAIGTKARISREQIQTRVGSLDFSIHAWTCGTNTSGEQERRWVPDSDWPCHDSCACYQ